MVLSNAERQKRYRQNLKARARGEDLPLMIRRALMDGLEAVYAIVARAGNDDSLGSWPTPEDAVAAWHEKQFIKYNGPVSKTLKGFFLAYLEDAANDDERIALQRGLDILDAVELAETSA